MPLQHVYLSNTNPNDVNRILIQIDDIRALSSNIKNDIEAILQKNIEIKKLIKATYKIDQ